MSVCDEDYGETAGSSHELYDLETFLFETGVRIRRSPRKIDLSGLEIAGGF